MLLPPSLEDWIPEDHPARFIDAFVESLDLQSLGFEVGHAPTGRPRYSARLLLPVYLYCYFDRIRSLRRMERACLENVAVMWLTGNERPDHNTLWRFYRDNKEAIRKVLKQSVKVAVDSNLVGMVLHAVDGTKIEAQASCKTAYFRKKLEKALDRADASIKEMEELLDASEEAGIDSYRLPEDLADAKKRKEKIRKSLAELDEAGVNSLQPSEPDARIMKCDGKLRVYHCAGYKECPARWQCSSNKRGRTIELIEHHQTVARQRANQNNEDAKAKLARRAVIVEPTFALAKHALEFRRWSHRDFEAIRAQWSLICTTINLHKLYTAWLNGGVALAKNAPARASSRLFRRLSGLITIAWSFARRLGGQPPCPRYLKTTA